jgi:hypothetical protein
MLEAACPTIGLGPFGPSAPQLLRESVDLLISDPEDLVAVAATLESRPLASLALVQLLRLGQGRGLHESLVAESLVYSTLQSGPEFESWLASRGEPKKRPGAHGPAVRSRREGDRLVIEFDRPEKRNAFCAEMRDGLCGALEIALADPSLEVELRGRGPAFCSGGDLDEFGTFPDPATAHAIRATRSAGRLLSRMSERVTVHVHGACIGAGIELPAFAGCVLADPDSFFQLPELSLGLVPGAGGTASLPQRIGRQRTAWFALSGARIDAETALFWGLVDSLEPVSGGA